MTLIMGVLNTTPDSFSDGGAFSTPELAIEQAKRLVAQGAHLIDIGGESTRPGAVPVSREEELHRVIPVIRAVSDLGVAVSVDTLHAETAEAAVEAGATTINDVSGGTHDPRLMSVAGDRGVDVILGHWRGVPHPGHERSHYTDVVAEVRDALAQHADRAIAAGVDPSRIVLDPGLGFDKTGPQCWELLAQLPRLTELGYRVMIGASRKRMLAEVLAQVPGAGPRAADRDLATAVVSALSRGLGVWGVRVHDVAATAQALAVADAFEAARAAEREEAGAPVAHRGTVAPDGVPAADGRVATETARDWITLTGLEVFAHHGVFEFEREQGQRFLIDAELSVDLAPAARGDQLERTVHYGELVEALVAAVASDPVDLIETVAERAAGVALGFPQVARARITVHKPDAPIQAVFADVSVTVERGST